MSNMFSGKIEKQIPKALTDCTKSDATVANLHIWAERLETWGKVLFIILIVIGIIATLAAGIETHEFLKELESYNYDLDELAQYGYSIPSVFEVVVTSLFEWGLYAFLEYCGYHVLALLISALASITQDTIISANVALYEVYQSHTSPEVTGKAITTQNSNNYYGARNRMPIQNGMWACSKCGTHNKNEYGQCKNCGDYRTK